MGYITENKWIIDKLGICLTGEPSKDINTLLFWIKSNYFTIMQQDRDIEELNSTIDTLREESNYEVYIAFDDKNDLYVGSGISGRHKHCTSGRSHVVELNRDVLAGNKIEVMIIADGLTKELSLEIEKLTILIYKPLYNKKINKNINGAFFKAFLEIVEEGRKEKENDRQTKSN